MKKWLPAIVLLCGVLVVTWFYHNTPPELRPAATKAGIAAQDAAVSNALARQSPDTVAIIRSNFAGVRTAPAAGDSATSVVTPARAGPPSPLEFTNFPPTIALERMRKAIRQYGDMFGGNPVGNNSEITAALKGNNSKSINFIDAEAGMRVNAGGELVDPWGTPYFFHQISAAEMEVRSAGPDKTMWTDDDLVVR